MFHCKTSISLFLCILVTLCVAQGPHGRFDRPGRPPGWGTPPMAQPANLYPAPAPYIQVCPVCPPTECTESPPPAPPPPTSVQAPPQAPPQAPTDMPPQAPPQAPPVTPPQAPTVMPPQAPPQAPPVTPPQAQLPLRHHGRFNGPGRHHGWGYPPMARPLMCPPLICWQSVCPQAPPQVAPPPPIATLPVAPSQV